MNRTNDKNIGAAICRPHLAGIAKKQNVNLVGGAAHSDPHFEGITKKQNGITLVALIITIILMLILAGVTINIVFDGDGIIGTASESKYKTELKQAIEEYEYFVHKKSREDVQFEVSSLMIDKDEIIYNTKEPDETGNIYTVLANTPKKYADCLEVINGELYYSNENEKKQEWAQDLGLRIIP